MKLRKLGQKKGSLSLSMEAIVILILAVVMLGLGLTFIRGMFSNISDKATKAIDVASLTAKPSEGDPVVFSPATVDVKQGKTVQVEVGFYNSHNTNEEWIMEVVDDTDQCGGLTDPDTLCYDSGIAALYNDKAFTLQKDQTVGWNIIFEAKEEAIGGGAGSKPYLFTIRFCGADTGTPTCTNAESVYQKELFMTVRS